MVVLLRVSGLLIRVLYTHKENVSEVDRVLNTFGHSLTSKLHGAEQLPPFFVVGFQFPGDNPQVVLDGLTVPAYLLL